MKQREKPGISKEQFCNMLSMDPATTQVTLSGGQFENFRRGWAVNIQPGTDERRSHFYTRSTYNIAFATSLCGRSAGVRWIHGPGNYRSCTHCKRIMKVRRISHTEE